MFFTAAASISMISMLPPSAANFSASMGWMPSVARSVTTLRMLATRKAA